MWWLLIPIIYLIVAGMTFRGVLEWRTRKYPYDKSDNRRIAITCSVLWFGAIWFFVGHLVTEWIVNVEARESRKNRRHKLKLEKINAQKDLEIATADKHRAALEYLKSEGVKVGVEVGWEELP